MESGLLLTPDFSAFSKKVVPFLHVTTHLDGRPNEGMLQEKGGTGFPTLMFLDAEGEILGTPGGRSAEAFEKTLASLMNIKSLEARIAAGEKGLKAELFFAELDMGKYSLAEVKAKSSEFKKLTKEQKDLLAQHVLNLGVKEILDGMGRDEGALAKAGEKLLAIKAEGSMPTGDALGGFWFVLMNYSEAQSDADLFAEALAALKVFYADEPRAMEFLNKKDEVLKEMQDAGEEVVVEGR